VLGPLAELAPDLVHPQTGQTIREHWQECDASRHPLTPVNVIL
jgi:7,8-dihydro-6-hydroxymethylpterin-pyrophosphokinase